MRGKTKIRSPNLEVELRYLHEKYSTFLVLYFYDLDVTSLKSSSIIFSSGYMKFKDP